MTKKLYEQDEELAMLNHDGHLAAYDLLSSTAEWLENPDNEVFGCLEDNEDSLEIAAQACTLAAAVLKKASFEIQLVSGIDDDKIHSVGQAMEKLQVVADKLDSSPDPELQKTAGVLDQLLMTFANDLESRAKFKEEMSAKIRAIKDRAIQANLKTAETPKPKQQPATEKKTKQLRPLEAALSSRYCPDHHGAMLYPFNADEGLYQCAVDGKKYDMKQGYTLENGSVVPGTAAERQTELDSYISQIITTNSK